MTTPPTSEELRKRRDKRASETEGVLSKLEKLTIVGRDTEQLRAAAILVQAIDDHAATMERCADHIAENAAETIGAIYRLQEDD